MRSLKLLFNFILIVLSFNSFAESNLESSSKVQNKYLISGNWHENLAQEIVRKKLNISDKIYHFFTIENSIQFIDNDFTKRIILFKKQNEESCHYCPGYVGCAIFVKKDKEWQVEFLDVLARLGEWSHAPDGKLLHIGKDKYGVYYKWTHFSLGGGRVQNYSLLVYDKGLFRNILKAKSDFIPVSSDSDLEKKGQLKIIKKQTEYFDIKIDSNIFQFTDGMYVLVHSQ